MAPLPDQSSLRLPSKGKPRSSLTIAPVTRACAVLGTMEVVPTLPCVPKETPTLTWRGGVTTDFAPSQSCTKVNLRARVLKWGKSVNGGQLFDHCTPDPLLSPPSTSRKIPLILHSRK